MKLEKYSKRSKYSKYSKRNISISTVVLWIPITNVVSWYFYLRINTFLIYNII